MNYHPIFAITVVLCALSLGAFAQNETPERAPAAVLIDEMKTSGRNCEEMLARLDVFFNELQNNPADQGYVIIYEEPSSRHAARRREYQLVNHVGFRRFDRGRLTLVRGSVRNDAVVQFWRVPAGAETPAVRAADSQFKEPEPVPRPADEPYIYATEHVDGIAGCDGPVYDLARYADLLKDEETNRGTVVIGAPSQADFRKRSAEIIGELAENGVEKNRIRTVFRKVKKDALEEFVELWIVPPATRSVPIADPTLHSAGKLPTLAGNIVRAVKPAYPAAARAVGAGGPVAVAVTLDEEGNVVAARALSGHALLRSAAVKAAKETVYSPSIVDGRPAGITGVIVFNFVPPLPPPQ